MVFIHSNTHALMHSVVRATMQVSGLFQKQQKLHVYSEKDANMLKP